MKNFKAFRTGLSSFQDLVNVLFRALGLNVIVQGLRTLQHFAFGKGYDEPTKIAIRKNRTTAMLRAMIHIVPLGVALSEIILNWNGYFVEPTTRNQGYYQFGAKIHEMTAQASLAAIVFTYVSYEISLGQGLPFGALADLAGQLAVVHGVLGLHLLKASPCPKANWYGGGDQHRNHIGCYGGTLKRDSVDSETRLLASGKYRHLDQCNHARFVA